MPESHPLRSLGLGRLWLRLYHQPVGRLRDVWRQGGPWAMRETERQRRAMEATAATLPPLPEAAPDTPNVVHLLSGSRFWYQTVFCLHSLARAAGEPIRAELHDDGTMDADTVARFRRLGSAVQVHRQEEIRDRLDRHLPSDRYPVLRERWLRYPNIRKLTDVHLARTGWKLVIDSDLLFFRRPEFLLQWLRHPDRLLHAVDCRESYGYSRGLLESLAGAPLPSRVNVGLCGMRSESLDWDELESWCTELQTRERTSYYLEQALVAMLAARQPCAVAPAEDYLTFPARDEVRDPLAVMHHYVAESKRWYFRHGWRHVLDDASTFPPGESAKPGFPQSSP